jgi:hypothetical protein
MSFLLDDTIDIEMSFVEKRNRGTKNFECYLEVTVCPDADYPCQILYPLGDTWAKVKKSYPTFTDIMRQIHGLHEICRELNQIRILKIDGDEGLYDQSIEEWNNNLQENV